MRSYFELIIPKFSSFILVFDVFGFEGNSFTSFEGDLFDYCLTCGSDESLLKNIKKDSRIFQLSATFKRRYFHFTLQVRCFSFFDDFDVFDQNVFRIIADSKQEMNFLIHVRLHTRYIYTSIY